MKNLDVMISINPPYSDMIMRKYKMVEFRKRIINDIKCKKAYIYETKSKGGIGKVIGECKIYYIVKLNDLYEKTIMIREIYDDWSMKFYGHIDDRRILYFDNNFKSYLKEIGYNDSENGYNAKYGLRLCTIKKYDKPLELSQFLNSKNEIMKRPPQNMCYCKKIEV